jgi:hypothetical protein
MILFNDGEEEEKPLSIIPEELTDVEDKQKRKRKTKNKTMKRKRKSITWDD